MARHERRSLPPPARLQSNGRREAAHHVHRLVLHLFLEAVVACLRENVAHEREHARNGPDGVEVDTCARATRTWRFRPPAAQGVRAQGRCARRRRPRRVLAGPIRPRFRPRLRLPSAPAGGGKPTRGCLGTVRTDDLAAVRHELGAHLQPGGVQRAQVSCLLNLTGAPRYRTGRRTAQNARCALPHQLPGAAQRSMHPCALERKLYFLLSCTSLKAARLRKPCSLARW